MNFTLTIGRERELAVLLSLLDLNALAEETAVTAGEVAANLHRCGYWRWGELYIVAELKAMEADWRVRAVGNRYLMLPTGEGILYGWSRFAARRRKKLKRLTFAAVSRMRQLVQELERVPSAPAQLSETPETYPHHSVYVVLLAADVLRRDHVLRVNPNRNPCYPCVYVGMTGLPQEARYYNHKRGYKGSRWVRRYGICLWEDFTDEGPMPYEEALESEGMWARTLRDEGWTVLAGHHDR